MTTKIDCLIDKIHLCNCPLRKFSYNHSFWLLLMVILWLPNDCDQNKINQFSPLFSKVLMHFALFCFEIQSWRLFIIFYHPFIFISYLMYYYNVFLFHRNYKSYENFVSLHFRKLFATFLDKHSPTFCLRQYVYSIVHKISLSGKSLSIVYTSFLLPSLPSQTYKVMWTVCFVLICTCMLI